MYTNVQRNIVHNNQKAEITQVSIVRWMNKHNVVYTWNGRLLSQKRNEILIHITTWLELEKIKWKKPDRKGKHTVWLHLYEIPRIGKFLNLKNKTYQEITRTGRVEREIWDSKKVLKIDSSDDYTMSWKYLMSLNYTLLKKMVKVVHFIYILYI